jgi:hypothetical protein
MWSTRMLQGNYLVSNYFDWCSKKELIEQTYRHFFVNNLSLR